LFVEDEPSIFEPFSKALAREGFEPVVATTVAKAIEIAERVDPDLVLLDLNLPDGNGLSLAGELAAGPATAGRPRPAVVAVTASVLPQDRAAALEAGCDGFLDKPYAAADLVAVVAEHLPKS
jgi:two-component system KDP operon response regulator KdpE